MPVMNWNLDALSYLMIIAAREFIMYLQQRALVLARRLHVMSRWPAAVQAHAERHTIVHCMRLATCSARPPCGDWVVHTR